METKGFIDITLVDVDALLEFNIAHEFRTTVVPTIHRKEDIEEICRKIIPNTILRG